MKPGALIMVGTIATVIGLLPPLGIICLWVGLVCLYVGFKELVKEVDKEEALKNKEKSYE